MTAYPVARATAEVTIFRRSGSTFTPISVGAAILPGEAIRFEARDVGVLSTFAVSPFKFQVFTQDGTEIFHFEANPNLFNGVAYVDTAAPAQEGTYTLKVGTSLLGLFPQEATMTFSVSAAAPSPIKPPPGRSFFGELETTAKWLVVGVVAVGAVVVVTQFKK